VVVKCNTADLGEFTEELVQQHCREHLAVFKVPSFVKFTDAEFPVNATNKVLKKQVKATYFP
jgi:acyl-CoA synthetase (AMP-forming)/AMP-acid ligase II